MRKNCVLDFDSMIRMEVIMKRIMKTVIMGISALALTCGLFSAVSYAETKTGTYSKLVATNDSGNSKAIATATNKTNSSKYLQVCIYRGNAVLVNSKEGITEAGAMKQVISSNSYNSMYAHSCIYNSASPNSGALEGLTATIK